MNVESHGRAVLPFDLVGARQPFSFAVLQFVVQLQGERMSGKLVARLLNRLRISASFYDDIRIHS